MSIICVGDLHLKKKLEYFNAQKKFLNWLNDNYKNDPLVLLGDIFDSAPTFDVYSEFKAFLKSRKNSIVNIIRGNHDSNFRIGEYLKGIHLMDNVNVFFESIIMEIENNKCLMLPYKNNMKEEYESIDGDYDFCFAHITHPKEAFGDEGIELKIKAKNIIYGHTHTHAIHNNNIIMGVNLPTRNGEISNPIIEIKNKEISYIQVPEFLKIETIKYEDDISNLNKDYIYNIKNSPSVKSVYEKFKEFYIRHEGIELKKDETQTEVKFDFDSNNLMKYFKIFIDENKINKEYSDIIAGYLVR